MAAPLFLHHIPKTGGTSLTRLLCAARPAASVFTEPGNVLSAGYTADLAVATLPQGALIHGHPEWGACRPWLGRARFITLLREPRAQIVSHFQHALRDPMLPQHAAARALGLRDFLRTYPYAIAFQTHALYRSMTDPAMEWDRALHDPGYGDALAPERYFAAQHRAVTSFLASFALVGTLEAVDDFLVCLAALHDGVPLPKLPHANRALPSQRNETSALLDTLDTVLLEPALAALFAIEQATYSQGRSLACAALAAHIRDHASLPETVATGAVLATNLVVDGQGGWWTGSRQLSRLRLGQQATCRMTLHVDRLHAVMASEVMLCHEGRWLDVTVAHPASDMTSFTAIVPAGRAALPRDLWLYLQWNRYPNQPPFHPALHIAAITVQAPE